MGARWRRCSVAHVLLLFIGPALDGTIHTLAAGDVLHSTPQAGRMTADHSSLRVLVIDDLEEVREQHRYILRAMGITNTADAADGREAIRILTDPENQFDLILCDLQMPHLDGIETIRALSYLGVQGAVAVLSVEEDQVMAGAGFLAEAHGLHFIGSIAKPLTKQALAQALQRMAEPAPPHVNGVRPPPPSAADVWRGLDLDEFTSFFQPQLYIATGELYGVESMLSWRHPTRGLLTADSFMHSALASPELLDRVSGLALGNALGFASRWRTSGHTAPVAVNVPGAVLECLEFPERLEALAAAAGVPHEMVRVELNEQELAGDPMATVDVAARLRLKRFGVSLDQFGGSEFGLQRLQHAPVTEVKLAREIVAGCSTTPTKQGVVEATITLAQRRGLTAVAEGVRHKSDWDHLREAGCEAAQGNYVVRPLGEEMLGVWGERW